MSEGASRSVEIKARVDGFAGLRAVLERLATGPAVSLAQEDTFFPCRTGRLKLRRFSASSGELIHYVRPDAAGPKESAFLRVATSEPDRLRDLLGAAHGTAGVVRKQRIVYVVGRTRVHLDDVEGVGTFLELEVQLAPGEALDKGEREARELMARLGLRDDQLVRGAYVDLLGPGA